MYTIANGGKDMDYRAKAAVIFAVIFVALAITASVICLGVKGIRTDKADTGFDGGVLVEAQVCSNVFM